MPLDTESRHRSTSQQKLDVILANIDSTSGLGIEQTVGQGLLASLQFCHLDLDGVQSDQFVDEDRLVLADTMGSVGGLIRQMPEDGWSGWLLRTAWIAARFRSSIRSFAASISSKAITLP